MIIRINTPMGQHIEIVSSNPETIGEWFTEHLPELYSDNASIPPSMLEIFSSSQAEARNVAFDNQAPRFYLSRKDANEWRKLGLWFLGIAGKIQEATEARNSSTPS